MRTATIELDGKQRILCFSTGVVENVCEKYGSLEDYFGAMGDDQVTQIRTVVWSLAQMMKAGDEYAKQKGIDNPPPLSEEYIRTMTDISELTGLQKKIQETITNGSKREVDAEPPKNGEATPEHETAAH